MGNSKKHPVKAMNIAKKLMFRLFGGDCNEIVHAGIEDRFDDLAEYCREINRCYSSRVFSPDNIKYMKENWSECQAAYNEVADDPWKYMD